MKKPTGLRVEFHVGSDGDWWWTQYARNGKIRASSSEGFSSRDYALKNWRASGDEQHEIAADAEMYERTSVTWVKRGSW